MTYTQAMWNECLEKILWMYRAGVSTKDIATRVDLSVRLVEEIIAKHIEKQ